MTLLVKWFTENLASKLISLLLAIGFWFYVVGEESIEITKTIPLEVRTPSEKISLVKSSTSFLEATFKMPRHLLSVISSEDIKANHDVASVQKAGDYTFNVSEKDFSLPSPEIRVTKIFPSSVTVTLDEVIVKKLPIRVDLVGEPAYGYRVDQGAVELDPNAVLVEGPKAILEKMDAVETEPIQLVGRVRAFRRKVAIRKVAEVKVVGEGVSDVQIPVHAEFAEKELTDVPVKPLGIPWEGHYVKLGIERLSLVLKGPRVILDPLELKDILAYVDVEGLKSGAHEVPLQLILPPDLSLRDEAPLVSVQVSKAKS